VTETGCWPPSSAPRRSYAASWRPTIRRQPGCSRPSIGRSPWPSFGDYPTPQAAAVVETQRMARSGPATATPAGSSRPCWSSGYAPTYSRVRRAPWPARRTRRWSSPSCSGCSTTNSPTTTRRSRWPLAATRTRPSSLRFLGSADRDRGAAGPRSARTTATIRRSRSCWPRPAGPGHPCVGAQLSDAVPRCRQPEPSRGLHLVGVQLAERVDLGQRGLPARPGSRAASLSGAARPGGPLDAGAVALLDRPRSLRPCQAPEVHHRASTL
jgi:hypothetical protein